MKKSVRKTEEQPVLSVVIPAYNEVLTIREILSRIVVDDGSTDGTWQILQKLEQNWDRKRHPHATLEVIFQPENGGKGKALRTGFAAARGRLTLIQDADLEYDPGDYPALIDPILDGHADVAYGSHAFAFGRLDESLGHIRRDDRGPRCSLLGESGFEVESVSSLNMLGLFGWFVNGRLLRRKLALRWGLSFPVIARRSDGRS